MDLIYFRHNTFGNTPHYIPLSKITCNELTFVLKGELVYNINGQTVKLRANDCICVREGEYRKRESYADCDYFSFNFKGDFSNQIPLVFNNCVSNEIILLLNTCNEIFNKYHCWSDKIQIVLQLIIQILCDKLAIKQENPTVIKIKRYIDENLSQKLTLKEIARQVGYSPNYCDALFTEQTDNSIINYIINLRIEKAKRLIAENILPLQKIAENLGFTDYNYFSRIFKKKSGYSPTEYRQIIYKKLKGI